MFPVQRLGVHLDHLKITRSISPNPDMQTCKAFVLPNKYSDAQPIVTIYIQMRSPLSKQIFRCAARCQNKYSDAQPVVTIHIQMRSPLSKQMSRCPARWHAPTQHMGTCNLMLPEASPSSWQVGFRFLYSTQPERPARNKTHYDDDI
jgi:hypothetical protein